MSLTPEGRADLQKALDRKYPKGPLMTTIKGQVSEVFLEPGRPDMAMVNLYVDLGQPELMHAFSIGGEGTVTCDGKEVSVGELFEWIAKTTFCEVSLHPEPERYDLSLKTDFSTTKGPSK